LLLGLTASYFSKGMSMVGLDYWVGFKRPIYADETIRMEWFWADRGCCGRAGKQSFQFAIQAV
jgi:hypothetical protein